MTDYPVEVIATFTGAGLGASGAGWHDDDNPATVATFHTAGSTSANRFQYDLSEDLTAVTGLVGWRVEVDVISGSGQLYWNIAYDHPSGSGYVAFNDYITVAGAGTYQSVAGSPYFVSSTGGHTYGGLADVVTRLAYEVVYKHGYGKIEPVFGSGGDIVVSEYRVIFFTDDVVSAIRQWPRDDSKGINSVTRVYPPPRAHRVIGGQP